ncbi:hypothetical protein P171DRAFT_156203 [Karstenula rhodostoma CBS 690.94]|uniref:Uncharacterized protein n=1 Tax=Karstenula rhodostoma CBS 690.94 TaxID=1392251 RepID=A0A9P4U659_9PLEO|nr:hypothetical protein P171DRAFT_156203 [Karstenula rhodostoma CBS 690.94]
MLIVWRFCCFMLSTLVTPLVRVYSNTRLRVFRYERRKPSVNRELTANPSRYAGCRRSTAQSTRNSRGPCKLIIVFLSNGMVEQFFVLHNKHFASQQDALKASRVQGWTAVLTAALGHEHSISRKSIFGRRVESWQRPMPGRVTLPHELISKLVWQRLMPRAWDKIEPPGSWGKRQWCVDEAGKRPRVMA